MIVRLMGEGQWEVDDSLVARLNELDVETERALDAGDQATLTAALQALADTVRDAGRRLDDTYLGGSDAIVPPSDLTLDEARDLMGPEGLIPDLP